MKFWKRAILINLAVILAVVAALAIFFATPAGSPALKTALLVPEVVPNFPVKPLRFLSREPKIEEITLKVAGKEIKADLYRLQDNKRHPAIIFTLGTIVTRKNPTVTKISQALARSGFVVLVPDLPDFLSGFVWIDSVNTLISSVEFLDEQGFVDDQKIGFAGFCVGASASIIAAENEKISDKVAFISAISPYFDLRQTTEAVTIKQALDENELLEPWEPAKLSIETVQKGFINYVSNEQERQLLKEFFLENKEISEEKIANFSTQTKAIYNLLTNVDWQKRDEVWSNLSPDLRDFLNQLSPSTNIANLKAKLFVLNDKKDTFVPRIEGVKLAKSLPKEQIFFVEVDSFEHVNPKTKLPRLVIMRQLWQLGGFIYRVLYYSG